LLILLMLKVAIFIPPRTEMHLTEAA